MEQNKKKISFKKLLDRLQEQSWQLELLISGFAIFGLFYAIEPIERLIIESRYNGNINIKMIYQVISYSLYILIFNLILHVVLRSLWIGTLGLRYVSGEIDIDKLNYHKKFTKYLKKKVGSFDDYISALENFCSIIFTISFLLIFYVISFFIIVIIWNLIANTFNSFTIKIIFLVVFAFGALLTFIDFITQGILKKNNWTVKIYYPFYWFFSYLTLSFLYRPLLYNLLDNKFGKRISLFLLPFYLIILTVHSLHNQESNYINTDTTKQTNAITANGRNYEDMIQKNDLFIDVLSIQSKVITDSYLKVIVPLNNSFDDEVFKFNKNLKPIKDNRGYKIGIGLSFTKSEKYKNIMKRQNDSLNNEYLKVFNTIYSLKIDSVIYHSDFIISNNKDELGFETYLKFKDLTEGKHILNFQKLKHKKKDSLIDIRKIPFWHFKEK